MFTIFVNFTSLHVDRFTILSTITILIFWRLKDYSPILEKCRQPYGCSFHGDICVDGASTDRTRETSIESDREKFNEK